MTEYKVDPAASGANNGSSWTDAWTSLQSAADTAVAGDVVYCRGTQTLSAAIDFDTNSGDATSGYIKFIGCNSGGTNDGTAFVLNGNTAATNCIAFGDIDYIYIENFQCHSATGDGVNGSANTNSGIIFLNCIFNGNTGDGIDAYFMYTGSSIIRCLFYGNANGITNFRGSSIAFSCARDNIGDGIDVTYNSFGSYIHNLVFDNGDNGFENIYGGTFYGNVLDSNVDDGFKKSGSTTGPMLLMGNRITNQSGAGDAGVNCNNKFCISGWNYFEDNTTNISNSGVAIELLDDGSTTNQADQADTNEGYTSKTEGAEDYNLTSDATLRRTAIQIKTGQ